MKRPTSTIKPAPPASLKAAPSSPKKPASDDPDVVATNSMIRALDFAQRNPEAAKADPFAWIDEWREELKPKI